MSPITHTIKTSYPGMGSPAVSFTQNSQAAASGASTLTCSVGATQAAGQSGVGPVRHGKVRVKTEAAVVSFLVVAIVGISALDGTTQVVLYHGDLATAIPGVASAIVDQVYDFNSDTPLQQINIMINAGAATTISYEVVAGT